METIDNAPIGHLISAIVARLNPLTQNPTSQRPAAPQEFLPTRRLAGSLTASAIGTTISSPSGARGAITSLARFVRDGTQYIQINAASGIVRTCRYDTEVVTWAWGPVARPVPARSTSSDMANRLERSGMTAAAHQERLAAEAPIPKHAPRLRTSGILTGLTV